MKDDRDPIKVYEQLLEQKTAWNCSIVEAAERVERERVAERSETTGNPSYAGNGLPGEIAPQNGSQP